MIGACGPDFLEDSATFFLPTVIFNQHLWIFFFIIKDRVQLVVQEMHLMLKINHHILGLCKLLVQVPLDTVLLDTQGMGPVSFYFCHSCMVVC